MDGYTAAQIVAAEKPLLDAGEPLMARAASGLAEATGRLLAQTRTPEGRVLLLVGSGNNGGDALYAGAELAQAGVPVRILPVGARIHEEGLRAALAAGAQLLAEVGSSAGTLVEAAREASPEVEIVVDGVLGTGSAGRAALRGAAREVVDALLQERDGGATWLVVAADLPSGLDPDTGNVPAFAILPAALTVTFGACKAGLLQGRGPEVAGQIEVVDIGLASNLEGVVPAVRGSDATPNA